MHVACENVTIDCMDFNETEGKYDSHLVNFIKVHTGFVII